MSRAFLLLKVCGVVLMVSWALWFGGMMALLLFVIRLFKTSHDLGVIAAPVLFDTFANLQLLIGFIACLCATVISVISGRKRHALLSLLLLVAFAAAIVIRGWTHEIDGLRIAGASASPRFKTLHAQTGMAYSIAAVALLLSGIGWTLSGLFGGITRRTAAAIDFPVAASDR